MVRGLGRWERMRIGPHSVWTLLEGTLGLDGGSMFGIVPGPLWAKAHPPDERNRITMALRPLVIRADDGRCILVDAGIGKRFDEKQQAIYRYQSRGGGLVAGLARLGVQPQDVTDVIATHLHFDHVGGLLTRQPDGGLVPTLPRARVHLQEAAWSWARNPSQ